MIDEPAIRQPEPIPIGGGIYKETRDYAFVADARRNAERILASFTVKCAEAQVSCKVLEDIGTPFERICLDAQRDDLLLLGK